MDPIEPMDRMNRMDRTRVRTVLFAHLETWRPYTAFYIGLVGLAGAVLADQHPSPGRYLAAWATPTLGWLGGLYGGDYFDRHLDAEAKPQRPIPSGRMSANTALCCFVSCTVAGGLLSLALNWRTVLLVLVALAAGVSYSTVFKARGLSGNIVRGGMTALAFLYGAMMVTDYPPARLLPLALVFWLHDAASNLVGTVRDIEGDRKGGYLTFAVNHGSSAATRVAALLLTGAYALALAAPAILGRPWRTGFAVLLVSAAASAAFAVGPLFRLAGETRRPAYHAHEVLVFTRILLAGAFVVWTLGEGVGPVLVIAAMGATWVSQRLLRERYEFGAAPPSTAGSAAPAGAALSPEAVQDFVRRQLAVLNSQEGALSGLAGWERLIDIRLREPEVRVRLATANGRVTLLDPDASPPAARVVSVSTTGEVFRDIFLLRRSNPRRAYLTRRLTMEASAADMMRLNQLFNSFRQLSVPSPSGPSPSGGISGAPREDAPRQDAPRQNATRRNATRQGAPQLDAPQLDAPQPAVADAETGFPDTVVISDTTLRDGEQMPGVVFSPAQKREIARRLGSLGIPLIEAGFPVVSAEEAAAIRAVVDDGGDALVQVIARPVDRDVDAAIETGAHSIAVFIGTSESHLSGKLRMTPDEVLIAVDLAVRRAKRAGRQVVFAAEDATRTDIEMLVRVCLAAADAGADSLGLADTVGIAHPMSMAAMVRTVAARCPLPIAVHCHNDLGLATANSLAGVAAGASGVQCSVLGIGERAGNAPLEQVVMALGAALGHDTGLDLKALHPLAEYVSGLIKVPVPPYQPVVGTHAFTHESGLHLDGISQDPQTYEPYRPELVGRTRRIVLGKHSGLSAVRAVADSLGLELDAEQARATLAAIKKAAQEGELDPASDAAHTVRRFAASAGNSPAHRHSAVNTTGSRER
ncbi:UbiA family prenyltransferase [Streptomyces sp. HC44]|uniref:UbiA family prenyltransferase n=1 Tax=Streptomyces scabichelini TaxID=2711217 RepID=A0A6G4V8V7_9ACTN|nr:UbiA family prenyltransferase [Streptomyces scabichelini]NGO10411.1 UbiA family prenyltransferase [Streptomyces scabichelini]